MAKTLFESQRENEDESQILFEIVPGVLQGVHFRLQPVHLGRNYFSFIFLPLFLVS